MKKIMLALSAALLLTACSADEQIATVNAEITVHREKMAEITFNFSEITQQAMTRASLSELGLTDIWVFDYMGGSLMQTIHQASTDAAFGSPTLSLEYGEHTFYFVASRGVEPTVDTSAGTIVWSSVRDTFHSSLTMNVQPTSASSQNITLSRVVGRLRIVATDVVPATAAKLAVIPSVWYYGLSYKTGEPTAAGTSPLSVNIPSSYIGTTILQASFYTVSGSTPWQTAVSVALLASDESVIGAVNIPDIPMQRNHITTYSGGIVGTGRSMTIVASDDEWVEDTTVDW